MAEKKQEAQVENTMEVKKEFEQSQKKQKKDGKKMWQIISVVCLVGGLLVGFVFGTAFGFGMNIAKNRIAGERQAEKEKSGKYYKVAKEVTLGKYKGLKISLLPTEEDIQTEIESLLEEYTNYEKKKGVAENGDMVYGKFEGSIHGVKMDELCGSDYIDIGSNEWLKDFENAFVGMKTGKTKKVSMKIPEGTYGNESIDGKTVTFKLTLKYICGDAITPEYNDEFVQSVSDYQSVDEYNEYLKEKLIKEAEDEKAEYAWSEVVEASEIKNYPEDMIAKAKEEVLQGYYDMADIYGYTHDEMFQSFGCADEQDFVDTQLDELAKDSVKEIMVAQAISNKEGISYTKKDYNAVLEEEYDNNKSSYDSEEDYEKNNKQYLENTALIEKVKSWIEKKTNYEREEKK